ncbi:MAG: glycosyltransferase family 4 protein [Nitrospinae bacterium]|nr:glycosyltransferase family 4 protein [Nitrospinota bacterium]
MKAMKVGILTHSIDTGTEGAGLTSVGIVTKHLVENLVQIGDQEVEFVFIHSMKMPSEIYTSQEEIIFPHNLYSLTLSQMKEFIKELLSKGIDMLHVPDTGRHSPPIPLAFTDKNIKLVATNHGMANLSLPNELCDIHGLKGKFTAYKEFLKWRWFIGKRLTSMIVNSESMKQILSSKLSISKEKVHVIHHGVGKEYTPLNPEVCRNKLKEKYGIDFPFIFHLSAYQCKRKNIFGLLEAMKTLKSNDKLVVGGSKPPEVKEYVAKNGLKEKVVFSGFIEDDDLPLFYYAADVFAFPSFYEGFGMPIIESMACGTPVLTSNVYSMPEIGGDAALYVNPYNVHEITAILDKILSNKKLQNELIEKGLKRAKEFSWKKCAEEHLKVYKASMRK